MYTILVGITIVLLIGAIHGALTVTDYTNFTKQGKDLLTIVLMGIVGMLWLAFLTTTTTKLSKTLDVKQSKQPWHVIYKNDIKADIKIESCNGLEIPITPKDTVSKNSFNRFMPGLSLPWDKADEASVDITATNDVDSTTKSVILPKDNIIETWPKGMKPNKSKGHITKIEYRLTPVTQKWFNIPVDKTDYEEIRVTIEYEGQKDPSTAQLFGED